MAAPWQGGEAGASGGWPGRCLGAGGQSAALECTLQSPGAKEGSDTQVPPW